MGSVTISEFHERLVRDTFSHGMSDEGALLLFTILHCYQVEVTGPVLSNCPSVQAGSCISAITQRHCGEVVASLFGSGTPQADSMHWYHLWNGWGSYSRLDHLTPDERAGMRRLIAELEKHPFIARLVPEDFDPANDPE